MCRVPNIEALELNHFAAILIVHTFNTKTFDACCGPSIVHCLMFIVFKYFTLYIDAIQPLANFNEPSIIILEAIIKHNCLLTLKPDRKHCYLYGLQIYVLNTNSDVAVMSFVLIHHLYVMVSMTVRIALTKDFVVRLTCSFLQIVVCKFGDF